MTRLRPLTPAATARLNVEFVGGTVDTITAEECGGQYVAGVLGARGWTYERFTTPDEATAVVVDAEANGYRARAGVACDGQTTPPAWAGSAA